MEQKNTVFPYQVENLEQIFQILKEYGTIVGYGWQREKDGVHFVFVDEGAPRASLKPKEEDAESKS